MNSFKRYSIYLIGTLVMSLGIALMIKISHLGVGAWDVLNIGLLNKFGLTVGTWNLIVGAVLAVWVFIQARKYISIGTVLNVLLVGPFIDLFLWMMRFEELPNLAVDILVFGMGAAFCGIGGAVYVNTNLGAGPRDAVVLMIQEKINGDLFKIRLVMEISACVIGFVLGGPLFYGTVASSIIISYVYKVTNSLIIKRFSVSNGV